MGKTENKFVQHVRDSARNVRTVEIATVTQVNPLAIRIDSSDYYSDAKTGSAKAWTIYEPFYEDENGEFKNGQFTTPTGAITYTAGTYESRRARIKYNVGDLLAVQEINGGKGYIILAKIREVM